MNSKGEIVIVRERDSDVINVIYVMKQKEGLRLWGVEVKFGVPF